MRISSDKYYISFEYHAFAGMTVNGNYLSIFLFEGTDRTPKNPQIRKFFRSEQEAQEAYSEIQKLIDAVEDDDDNNGNFEVEVPY